MVAPFASKADSSGGKWSAARSSSRSFPSSTSRRIWAAVTVLPTLAVRSREPAVSGVSPPIHARRSGPASRAGHDHRCRRPADDAVRHGLVERCLERRGHRILKLRLGKGGEVSEPGADRGQDVCRGRAGLGGAWRWTPPSRGPRRSTTCTPGSAPESRWPIRPVLRVRVACAPPIREPRRWLDRQFIDAGEGASSSARPPWSTRRPRAVAVIRRSAPRAVRTRALHTATTVIASWA